MSQVERLFMRFVMLFLTVHRTSCDEPECRCRNHEVVGVSRLGVYTVLAFMLAMGLYACWVTHR